MGLRAALGLMACLAAVGCGFHPLYGDHAASASSEDFAKVYVAPISDRVGQQVRNFLLSSINTRGEPSRPIYTLNIGLAQQNTGIALSRDNTTSRTSITLSANFILIETATGKTVFKGLSRATDSYDVLLSDYATLAARDDAVTRAAREVSDDIKTRLAVYLQSRKQSALRGG